MAAAPETTYRMGIVGGLTPALGFSAHLPENRGEGFMARPVLTTGHRRRITCAVAFAQHAFAWRALPKGRHPLSAHPSAGHGGARIFPATALQTRRSPRRWLQGPSAGLPAPLSRRCRLQTAKFSCGP